MTAPGPAVLNPADISKITSGPFDTLPGDQLLHLPSWAYGYAWQPYQYAAQWLPLAALAQGVPQPIQVESNMVFCILSASMEVLDAANANPQAWPLIRCTIQQGGSGRSFMPADVFVPIVSMFGNAGARKRWTTPAIIQAQGTWQTILTNLTAIPWNVTVVYHGIALLL